MPNEGYTKMSTVTVRGQTPKSADSDVDRYIKESCRSFKECNIKNTARRNSLQKKTLGIESERRLASAKMGREERQLRQQLKMMNIEKAKNHIIHNLRETSVQKKKASPQKEEPHQIPIEPYPVTFRTQTPSPDPDVLGRLYASKTRRRQSHEFEDLKIHTKSGKLIHIDEDFELDEGPRRRVASMSCAQRPSNLSRLGSSRARSHSNASTPRTSPDLRRKLLSPGLQRKKGSTDSSSEALHEDKFDSLDDLHWIGDPEAIHSVRRPRKTVDEQELDHEIHKLKNS